MRPRTYEDEDAELFEEVRLEYVVEYYNEAGGPADYVYDPPSGDRTIHNVNTSDGYKEAEIEYPF